MTDNYGQMMGAPQPGAARSVSDGETTAVFPPFDVAQPIQEIDDHTLQVRHGKRHVIWPWIVLGVVAVFAAGLGGGFWFFQSHALPGVTLWGNPVMGQSQSHIAEQIDDAVSNATVSVKYEGRTAKVSLKDLGLSVDSDAIASDVLNAKRGDAWWQQYAFWVKKNVTAAPANTAAADNATLNAKLGVNEVKPVDAKVQLNADGNGFDVIAGQQGEGLDAKPVAQSALASVKSLGNEPAKAVTVSLKSTEPVVTDTIANEAKTTLDNLVKTPVEIKVKDHAIAAIDASALASSMRVDANTNGKLSSQETRNGYVVFDSEKLQQYYENTIKKNLHTGREDREVVVNNDGDELKVIKEGHDGVTVAEGADTHVGQDAIEALAKGNGSVTVEGTVDPMQTKTTKRHVVVDLSDGKVYAYENDQLIKTMNMSAGEGNVRGTGQCTGDLCTPTGDFKIWLKYQSQDMSGNLTLSDGSSSKWDVKDVGFVNYFSKSGCAIHRIVSPMSDAAIGAMNANTSHGCVGIGWDVAEWFYGWCLDGTSVHVQA
ncbi:L,D-transpeptidase [Bifidobacterium felsineum]|uniref:L,D-TPase catalytic domain-containing protein n=1 Tax=Bifidobacterium felsineum TaxID=2045440 RepID=A0A2M9HKK0_9BIFI|nr:L,D-transpeptidase [Bifidobacterium felsineum]PJM77346.1 hypothetical protein CSQ86_05555 [Bifidobacterium felsineum]